MNNQELRSYIEQQTGVLADLLTGQTQKEILQQARDILELQNQQQTREILELQRNQLQESKSTREQFAEWADTPAQEMERTEGQTARDLFIAWMNGPEEEEARPEPPAYPELKDGQPENMPSVNRPIREIFEESFSDPGSWGLGGW